MAQPSSPPGIPDMLDQMKQALARVAAAEAAVRLASADYAVALDALNVLQRAIDKNLAEVKAAAPARSDWSKRVSAQ